MPKLFAMTAPVLPGKEAEHFEFMNELKTRWSEDYRKKREDLGVRERTFLQQTPHGSFVIVTLEGEHPEEAMGRIGQGDDEFTKWFVEQVKNSHGIDMSQPMPGPIAKMIIDSQEMKEAAAM